jgi:HD-GYP domain-containing protein (c-di-GMP phosphodiesterase class II)
MNESLLDVIIQSQDIEYGVFDRDLFLIDCTAGFYTYLSMDDRIVQGWSITEAILELGGYDTILENIRDYKEPPLRIPSIYNNHAPRGHLQKPYYNLQAYPYQGGLLVIVRNVTNEGDLEQQIVQRRNELDLLAASLIDDLRKANLELGEAYETTLEGWAKALELRDAETKGHSQRVTELTLQLARASGISEPDLAHVRRGSLLHDIGKMGIPDHILLKPGPLDEEEWEIMRMHPTYAYELLYPIPYLRPALDIPYCHHERWDGMGYPRGMIGEQIPLAARIFSIIDVYDALISDRPYHYSWPREDALRYIRASTGNQFDPKVVELFFNLV